MTFFPVILLSAACRLRRRQARRPGRRAQPRPAPPRAAALAHRAELQPGGAYLFGAAPAAATAPFAEIDVAIGELLAAPTA